MKLSDFDFELPEALIATRPARPRSSARLLVADGPVTRDAHVYDLPQILRRGDRLILNDTRVIPARLTGKPLHQLLGGEREAIDETLRDLECDFETGKIGEADYRQRRAELEA